ncbi:MAG TPA: hypothetical protein VGR62_19155 [Candidatus Binatia bacterium]|jgi:hypothetical protein|nr:hypothetical protein [Candidatus Binatia bacterium]
MSKIRLVALSALVLATVGAGLARAEDISTKKLLIKDNANPVKRQVQVLSADLGVQAAEVDDPGTNGAAIHLYSATDDQCVILAGGPEWTFKNGLWKYNNKVTKNQVQVKNGKLIVKLKSGVTYSLLDNGTQGAVNAQVQFGAAGTRYCLRCTGTKDTGTQFLGKSCVAAPCAAEPSSCVPVTTTTTTVTPTTTTTSTTAVPGVELQGALTASTGRFNYNLTLGLAGANAACAANFAGTHACTYGELQAAETAGDLDGLKDTGNNTVTSFWAIDGTHANTLQCGASIPWDYQTAHTGQFGEKVNLTNGTGVLGPLLSGAGQGVFCAGQSWVGCCL